MFSLYIMIVGILHLLTVESAPSNLNNNRITVTPVGLNGLEIPILDNRVNLEDKRQNWGILINGSLYDEKEVNNGYRPIIIPRLSTVKPLLPAENVEKTPEVNINVKAKRYLEPSPVVYDEPKVKNTDARKTALTCNIAHIKCCFEKSDLQNCTKASECLSIKVDSADLCNPISLQESIRKVLNRF